MSNQVSILALTQQLKHATNQTINFTIYVYPLACSMYSTPATAKLRGDGTLLSSNVTADANTNLSPTPFIRPRPTDQAELFWIDLINALYTLETADVSQDRTGGGTIEFTWLEYTLLDRIVNGTGIDAMEDSLSYITALAYSLLAQSSRARGFAAANTSQSWIPQNVTLIGIRPVLFTRLRIGGPQLIVTFVSTIVLILVTLASTYGHADQHIDPIIRDGGAIDLLSLLADSSLPSIIAGGADDRTEDQDARRARAETTQVWCVFLLKP